MGQRDRHEANSTIVSFIGLTRVYRIKAEQRGISFGASPGLLVGGAGFFPAR